MKNISTNVFLFFWAIIVSVSCSSNSDSQDDMGIQPVIFPDYSDISIPKNIAPLSFIIRHPGSQYIAEFTSEGKDYSFKVHSADSVIIIPIKKWRKLLDISAGAGYAVTIRVKDDGGIWKSFLPISNRVKEEAIDPYITYRRINPGMIFWENMAIVQRSLEDYSENDLVSNQNSGKNCMNCHTFRERDPEYFMLHTRANPSGTLIKTKNQTRWLATKTPYTLSGFVYPAWHPGGRFIAFSTNKIHQNFFGKGNRVNHVRDDASDLVIYDLEENLVFTSPEIASYDFENIPAWSPEGDYLYYLCSPRKYKYLPDTTEKYDLMRISFNADSAQLGTAEKILSADSTGLSISFPQVSPNGKYLLFLMADYGYFNINNSTSDLYLMDLETREYKKLPVNSDKTESWPSWSDNSRWIMFTTKRIDGLFTVPHFSYFDHEGNAHKPFPLPFQNPEEYYSRITNINRPVFVKGKVKVKRDEIQKILYSETEPVIFDSLGVEIDALAGATAENELTPETSVPYMRD